MNDLKIRRDILDEMEFDPSVDAANIGVAVHDGIVTLSVPGVSLVQNKLHVNRV